MECGWDHDLETKIRQNGFLKDGLNKTFLYFFLPIRWFFKAKKFAKNIDHFRLIKEITLHPDFGYPIPHYKVFGNFFWENSRVSESIFFWKYFTAKLEHKYNMPDICFGLNFNVKYDKIANSRKFKYMFLKIVISDLFFHFKLYI